jgi:hypothetical protein
VTDILSRIPSANEMPENAEPTQVAPKDSRWSRRRLFGTIAGVTIAGGLGALDLLPWSKSKSAEALTEWTDGCHGFFDSSSICVPRSAIYSGNCAGSWHKTDLSHWSGCNRYQWQPYTSSCAGRNAWRWTSGTRRKCSDGYYMYYDCGGTNTNITRFSICRTAI